EGPLRFAQHHLFGVRHQPDAGGARVFEQGIDAHDLVKQALDVLKVLLWWQFHRCNAIEEWPRGLQHGSLEAEDVLHVPVECGGEADEAQRLRSRGAVEHDDVIGIVATILVYIEHGTELFHAGEDGHLLGFDVSQPGGTQNGGEVGGDVTPMPFHLLVDVDFLDLEVVGQAGRVGSTPVEERGTEVERVGQAVGRVDAHYEGAVAERGDMNAGCGRHAGLADAAFAAEEKNTHEVPVGAGVLN